MKHIKLYEQFKVKNFTVDDIVDCISSGGIIYSEIVKDFPENIPDLPLNPVSVDDEGLITVEVDGKNFEVDLKDVKKIEY
jgi:hypothetical protein